MFSCLWDPCRATVLLLICVLPPQSSVQLEGESQPNPHSLALIFPDHQAKSMGVRSLQCGPSPGCPHGPAGAEPQNSSVLTGLLSSGSRSLRDLCLYRLLDTGKVALLPRPNATPLAEVMTVLPNRPEGLMWELRWLNRRWGCSPEPRPLGEGSSWKVPESGFVSQDPEQLLLTQE